MAGAYRLLRAIMATAVDDELVRRNPCRNPGADKDNSPERPVATIPEVFAIAGAMRKWYPGAGADGGVHVAAVG